MAELRFPIFLFDKDREIDTDFRQACLKFAPIAVVPDGVRRCVLAGYDAGDEREPSVGFGVLALCH